MAAVVLQMAGPLQGWGMGTEFDYHKAMMIPGKSAVLGLCANALGLDSIDEEPRLLELNMTVRVDQEGSLLEDYQTTQNPMDLTDTGKYVDVKQYVQDAVFMVFLEHKDREWMEELFQALHCPARILYLGKKNCPVSPPFALDVMDEPVEELVQKVVPQFLKNFLPPRVWTAKIFSDTVPGMVCKIRDAYAGKKNGMTMHQWRKVFVSECRMVCGTQVPEGADSDEYNGSVSDQVDQFQALWTMPAFVDYFDILEKEMEPIRQSCLDAVQKSQKCWDEENGQEPDEENECLTDTNDTNDTNDINDTNMDTDTDVDTAIDPDVHTDIHSGEDIVVNAGVHEEDSAEE